MGEIIDNLLIILWKELLEIYTAFKSPVLELGRMAIAGEKNIEAGKGISGLGCCGAGGGTWAMLYDEERLAYGSHRGSRTIANQKSSMALITLANSSRPTGLVI